MLANVFKLNLPLWKRKPEIISEHVKRLSHNLVSRGSPNSAKPIKPKYERSHFATFAIINQITYIPYISSFLILPRSVMWEKNSINQSTKYFFLYHPFVSHNNIYNSWIFSIAPFREESPQGRSANITC